MSVQVLFFAAHSTNIFNPSHECSSGPIGGRSACETILLFQIFIPDYFTRHSRIDFASWWSTEMRLKKRTLFEAKSAAFRARILVAFSGANLLYSTNTFFDLFCATTFVRIERRNAPRISGVKLPVRSVISSAHSLRRIDAFWKAFSEARNATSLAPNPTEFFDARFPTISAELIRSNSLFAESFLSPYGSKCFAALNTHAR